MYDFESYRKARNVEEAIGFLAADPKARLIAGGTDVLIKLHKGKAGFEHLVDIHDLPELKIIAVEEDGSIRIGSGVRFTDLMASDVITGRLPLLAEAATTVGGPQVRNAATIGGNVCNGVPSADGAVPLFCLDAVLTLAGPDGERETPIEDFYRGPGKVDLRKAEVLTAFTIPTESQRNMSGHYYKYAMRGAMDIATIGCGVQCRVEGGVLQDLKMAFGVAGPVPMRCKTTEAHARGKKVTVELLDAISQMAAGDLVPRDSWRASKEFRLQIIKTLAHRVTAEAINRAGGTIS